jgi:predicted transcriptional regulator
MTSLNSDFCSAAGAKRSKQLSHKTTRDCPRVTVRLSEQDYARLQQLADGMSLSVYMRAMALNEALPKRKTCLSYVNIEDRSALGASAGAAGSVPHCQ